MDVIEVLDYAGDRKWLVDDYQTATWKRRYYGDSTFKFEIHPRSRAVPYILKERIAVMPDGSSFFIEQIEYNDATEAPSDKIIVTGKQVGMFGERVCLPPVGLSHDTQSNVAAESAMKHYVNNNAGPGAAVERRVPNLTIAADEVRGPNIYEEARYQYVIEILERISENTGVGWHVFRSGTDFVFEVVLGTDRSATVYFDQDFDTVLGQKFLTTVSGRKTVAYVAGQGQGVARTIAVRQKGGVTQSGLARREMFIDARDVTAVATLNQRGDNELAATQKEDVFEFEYNQHGSFQYLEHWDVGDVVTARNKAWDVQTAVRIVGVEETRNANGRSLKVELGRPWPTIKSIIEQKGIIRRGSSFD